MASHRNIALRGRPLAWALGVAAMITCTLMISVATILRTPDAPASMLRTALDRIPSLRHRRLSSSSSIPLTPNYHFDGTNSDLAQQLYRRHLAGASADPLPIDESVLPNRIRDRLGGLRFPALPPLLQRALIWDSGYALDPYPDVGVVKVYTVGGVPMSEIAIPIDTFFATNCTTNNCTNPDGREVFRSRNCTGDMLFPSMRCATGVVSDTGAHTAMWATGGSDTMVPAIQMIRHYWRDPWNNTWYLVHGIHTTPTEPAWDNCPTSGLFGSIVIPCNAYDSNDAVEKNWLEPRFGPIVTPWLDQVKAETKRRKILLFVVLPLGLTSFVVLVVCAACFVHRRRVAAGRTGLCGWFCGPVAGPYKDIWGRSLQHTLLSPSPPAVQPNGSGGSSGNGAPGLFQLPPSGPDLDAVQRKMPRRSSSSALTTASDRTSVAAWDRMNLVLLNDLDLYNKRVALERIQFDKQLSKGGFGEVWLATLDSHAVAVKRLLQSHRVRLEDVEAFVDEIQITAALHHPNIPRFIGVAWTTLDRLCMVIEYLPGGDLQSFLKRQGHLLTWPKEKRTLAMGIAKALQYLHSRAPVMIHRDIKSRNILVRDEPLTAKVTDFGVSRSVQRECMTLGVGTPYWTAPEVLDGTLYTEKSDIYSFGVVLSEIDTCETPYHDAQYGHDTGIHLQPFHILKMVMAGTMQPSFDDSCPPQLRALATRCLDVDPAARPTAREVVKELEEMTWT